MWFRTITYNQNRAYPVMSIEESRRTQRPYRYGMILLCIGALINWVGLADDYPEPVRYVGIASIIGGALLICAAMCCWLHTPRRNSVGNPGENDDPIHVITVSDQQRRSKPPDYDTVEIPPPSYDDAIKLSPNALIVTPILNGDTIVIPIDQSNSNSISPAPQAIDDQLSSSVSQHYDHTKENGSESKVDEKVNSVAR